jgi:hypothetical protein
MDLILSLANEYTCMVTFDPWMYDDKFVNCHDQCVARFTCNYEVQFLPWKLDDKSMSHSISTCL